MARRAVGTRRGLLGRLEDGAPRPVAGGCRRLVNALGTFPPVSSGTRPGAEGSRGATPPAQSVLFSDLETPASSEAVIASRSAVRGSTIVHLAANRPRASCRARWIAVPAGSRALPPVGSLLRVRARRWRLGRLLRVHLRPSTPTSRRVRLRLGPWTVNADVPNGCGNAVLGDGRCLDYRVRVAGGSVGVQMMGIPRHEGDQVVSSIPI